MVMLHGQFAVCAWSSGEKSELDYMWESLEERWDFKLVECKSSPKEWMQRGEDRALWWQWNSRENFSSSYTVDRLKE